MGRLDDIIARNKHPTRHMRKRFPLGILVSAFVLLVIVLMIFTDMGMTSSPAPQPPQDPPGEKRVRGIQLYRVPADAAVQP